MFMCGHVKGKSIDRKLGIVLNFNVDGYIAKMGEAMVESRNTL